MFCGPHTESGHPSMLRITRAIEIARLDRVRLLIVGDAYDGTDVDLFVSMAKEQGVDRVIPLRVASAVANTETNAQQVAVELTKQAFATVSQIYLVTNHWHMQRVTLHLTDALKLLFGANVPRITPMHVTSATKLSEPVLLRERQLISVFREKVRKREEKIAEASHAS